MSTQALPPPAAFTPTLGTHFGFWTVQDLDAAIAGARHALEHGQSDTAARQLSTALRYRFFRAGTFDDFKESVFLVKDLPRPTFEDIGTASITPTRHHFEFELDWLRLQPWLEAEGYQLPPRYRPGWQPSWLGPNRRPSGEDAYAGRSDRILARRTEDSAQVWLKLCPADSAELEISAFFMASPRRSDPRNHCCPLLDFLRPPLIEDNEYWLTVSPFLHETLDPLPDTVEETTSILLSLAEGLAFMHEHNVAHRDICLNNTMMDATHLIPTGWSPYVDNFVFPTETSPAQRIRVKSRSRVPVTYYFIDFGLSSIFPSFSERRLVVGDIAQNLTVPELSKRIPYDPFALDMRMFGDIIRRLQEEYIGLEFLQPLVQRLVSDNPAERIDAREMLVSLTSLLQSRSKLSRLAPFCPRDSSKVVAWIRYPFRLMSGGPAV